jgi:hypothetical protein
MELIMDKKEVLSFNRHISRIYSLVILNVAIFIMALTLNYYCLNNNIFLYIGLALNFIALILFKPWAMMRDVRELYASQRMLEEFLKTKEVVK